MKTTTRLAALAVLLLLVAPVVAGDRATHPKDLEFGALDFEIPRTDRRVLPNGMVVHLMENHELPLVSVIAWVRTGSKYDPADKIGLGTLTGVCMRAGGSQGHPADAMDEELDRLAAVVGTSIASEHGVCNLNVLTRNLDRGLDLFAEILRTPAFPEPTLGLYKNQMLAAYRTRNDDPGEIAARELTNLLYGDHPYAREAVPATINAITRDDLVDCHARTFHPNNIILGVAGDFASDEMIEKLVKRFGDWKPGEAKLPEVPAVDPAHRPGVHLVEKDLSQSNIRIGMLGVKRNTEERVKADLMNIILGGGSFGSRLNGAVRGRGGLAYSIYSHFTRSVDLGIWQVVTETKTGSTWKAIGLIFDEIRRMRDEPVTADELQMAKDMILNGMVFGFADPAAVVDAYVSLEYYGYPEDWYDRYFGIVRSMTVDEIRETAKRRLDPEEMTVLIVGKAADMDERPEGIAEPKPVDID